MYELDATVTQAINGLSAQHHVLSWLMIWTSTIGVPALVLVVAIQWWSKTDRLRTRHVVVAAGLSFLLGLAMNQLILLLVHRVRPYDAGLTQLLIAPSADPSFPSDHATATFAVAATFLLHGKWRLGSLFALFAALMMVSRVWIGTHYVGDVLGGAATGFVVALLVRTVYKEGSKADRFITGIL